MMSDCKWVRNASQSLCCSLTFFIALRIEWCKARAREMCWSEAVALLMEEMRRVNTLIGGIKRHIGVQNSSQHKWRVL
jgi:hypothetical protein